MQLNLLMAIILPIVTGCQAFITSSNSKDVDLLISFVKNIGNTGLNPYKIIDDIPVPAGFERITAETNSFAGWLRNIGLKADKTVYLYNGSRKANQSAQFAVLDISVGNKDLQQCADAVMRLRAEYLYKIKNRVQIDFTDNNNKHYRCPINTGRKEFDAYLEKIFSYCGTLSLEKQLRPVRNINAIQPGDVFIKGGSPGHAVIVVDVAINKEGKKIYMLAQSYMPAQDIHILVNPGSAISPWYEVNEQTIQTPQWTFFSNQLKTW